MAAASSPILLHGFSQAGPQPPRSARAWEVLHACEDAAGLLDVVDAQLAVGMRPYVVTPSGILRRQDPPATEKRTSLLQAWQSVRKWRKHLDDVTSAEIHVVHAHSFAAGMASVRGRNAVAYDVRGFVEDLAAAQGQSGDRSWLGRSFRAAEQFVLAQAGAIVVHSSMMRKECIARGVSPERIFVIPEPVRSPVESRGRGFYQQAFGFGDDALAIFAPESAQSKVLLEALALLVEEVPEARLFVATEDRGVISAVHYHAQEMGVDHAVFIIQREDEEAALASADIVIAGPGVPTDAAGKSQGSARERLDSLCASRVAVEAMMFERPLLAADVPCNREVSSEGRGCLWYRPGDARDIAHRASFLARNPEFRAALAQNGRQHIVAARDPEKIGLLYDEAYRFAFENHSRGERSGGGHAALIPAQAGI